MSETLNSLLEKREQLKEETNSLTKQITQEAEKYVLSTLYLASKINNSSDMKRPELIDAVKRLYDSRFDEHDLGSAINNLTNLNILREHKKINDHPSSYSLAQGEFEKMPLIEYLTKEQIEQLKKDEDNLLF